MSNNVSQGRIAEAAAAANIFVRVDNSLNENEAEYVAGILKNLPFIDPDSSRQVDDIAFKRQARGIPTYGRIYDIPQKKDSEFQEMCEILAAFFPKGFYSSENVFRGLSFDTANGVPHAYIVLEKTSNGIYLSTFGDKAAIESVVAIFKEKYTEARAIVLERLIAFGANGPEVKSNELKEDEQDLAFDAFYPYLAEQGFTGIDDLLQQYKNNSATTIVFIGPRGTGKSTLQRTMMFKAGYKRNASCSNEQALLHPGFSSWLEQIAGTASEEDAAFVCIEDADNYLMKREAGNTQMSALLNFTDGILGVASKIVISTNLSDVKNVDDALLRNGRTFRVVRFRNLTIEEANVAREAVGLDPLPDDLDLAEISLAAALNFVAGEDNSSRQAPAFGFNGGVAK